MSDLNVNPSTASTKSSPIHTNGATSAEGFSLSKPLQAAADRAKSLLEQAVTSYEKSLRTSPFIHMAVVGVGAITLGFFAGRMLSGSRMSMSQPRSARSRDFDMSEGYQE